VKLSSGLGFLNALRTCVALSQLQNKSDSVGLVCPKTRHQFVTKTRLFYGYFELLENRKSKGAKGFKGCHLKN
jgi:hypothetical protein